MRKLNYFPLVALASISILLDFYVFGGIKTLTRDQPGSTIVQSVYWLISGAILVSFLYMLSRVFPARKFSVIFNISFNSFLTVFVTKLAFAVLLFGEDIYRLLIAGYNLISSEPDGLPSRSILLSQVSLITSTIPFFSFLFGVTFGKYYYRVRRSVIFYEDLPEAFDNFTIVQISDIHAGSLDNPVAVRKGVRLINAQKPDLVAFTGDLVNNKATEIVPYLEIFKEIEAPFGKFSILGNHDYGDYIGWTSPEAKRLNLEALKGFHGEMGFTLLMDSSASIYKDKQSITLMGVENWGKGFGERGDLRKALNGSSPNDFKILLSHDPTHWDAQVKNHSQKIHLTLSGHTHGMQFGIELGKFKWSPAKYRYENWAGLAESQGRYLYVNRGFGFLGFAGRVGIWPEITVIQLKSPVRS